MTNNEDPCGATGAKTQAINVLADLNPYKQWVGYNAEKKPLNPRGGYAKADDPSTWGTRAEAAKRGKGKVGIELGPIVGCDHLCLAGVDLDGCRDLDTKAIAPWARETIAKLGTYVELSPSGTGLHALFLYRPSDLPEIESATPSDTGGQWKPEAGVGIEFYFRSRYLTVTEDQFGTRSGLKILGVEAVKWIVSAGDKLMAGNVEDFPKERSKKFDEAAALRDLMSGASFHPAAISLAGYWAKTGVAIVEAHARLKAAFEAIDPSDRDDRWKARFKQIPEILQYTYGKAAVDEAGIIEGFDEIDNGFDQSFNDLIGYSDEELRNFGRGAAKPAVTKSEADLCDDFVEKYKKVLRYNTDSKLWHEWTGTHWQPETTGLAYDYAATVCRTAAGKSKSAKVRTRSATAASVERLAKAHRAFVVKSDHFDRDPWLLGTPGGTVDLRTGELRDAVPGEYISKLTAVAPGGDCPQWKKFIRFALGSDDMVRFAQQWFGYCLTGDTREEKFGFGWGPGGGGKGTTIETIVHILGDYAANIPIEALTEQKFGHGHTTELASLQGARFVWSSETDPQAYWDQQRVTSLTGGEKIKARLLYENAVEFKPAFKITVVGNHAPRLRNVDAAIRRRLFVLPFDHPPDKPDLTLKPKLKGEASGILAWMIEGCLDWQKKGLTIPQDVVTASEEYLGSEDDFTEWLEASFEKDPESVLATSVLWPSWEAFCDRKNLNPGSLTRTFPRELKKRGFKAENLAGHVRGWRGLAEKFEGLI